MAANNNLFIGQSLWIFGCGSFGRALAAACVAHGAKPLGFLQSRPSAKLTDGLAIRTPTELTAEEKRLPVMLGVFNRDTPLDELHEQLWQSGFENILMPWDAYAHLGHSLGWRYWLTAPTYPSDHREELQQSSNLLGDELSRRCLERVVAFRSGADLSYASFTHSEAQYFNHLTLPGFRNRPLRYLDGGAYDGDSFRELQAVSAIQKAWLLEPDPDNHRQLKRQHDAEAQCLALALSDKPRTLRFSSGIGEAGHVGESGDQIVEATSIDVLLNGEAVDFIKLDIEGSEADALRGAAETLRLHRPVLALSSYHHPHDLWALPKCIASMVEGYRFYLRQHHFNSFDLVLYAVPAEQSA